MKKIFWYSFLAGILISSSGLVFAAVEKEQLNRELEEDVYNCRIPEVTRLLQAGADPNAYDQNGEHILCAALLNPEPESVELVKLLIAYGADVGALWLQVEDPSRLLISSLFEFTWTMLEDHPFEGKKAKLEALLDGGTIADWGRMRSQMATILQRAERSQGLTGSWYTYDLTRAQWDELLQAVKNKVEEVQAKRCGQLVNYLPAGLATVVVQYVQGDDHEAGLHGVTPVVREEQGAGDEQI